MPLSPTDQLLIDLYLNAAGQQDAGRFTLTSGELAWLLRHVSEWNIIRLRLLTALQHALPTSQAQDKAAQELKETLTNVIIMQTRLREREEALVRQLEAAAQSGSIRSVVIDASDARAAGERLLTGQKHLQGLASG